LTAALASQPCRGKPEEGKERRRGKEADLGEPPPTTPS
jgi:hypothetical protein